MKRSAFSGVLALAVASLLVACGGAASTSTTPAAVHTAEPGEPALIQVDGYQYQNPTDPTWKQSVTEGMKVANALVPGIYVGGSAHEVIKDGAGQTILVEMQLGPKMAGSLGESLSAASGAITGMAGPGVAVSTETISTQPVASAVFTMDGQHYKAFAWVHNGAVTLVLGENDEQTTAYMQKYLAAAHA